jgi:hypothetical protein
MHLSNISLRSLSANPNCRKAQADSPLWLKPERGHPPKQQHSTFSIAVPKLLPSGYQVDIRLL